jgi:hypothetical protein
MLGIAAKSSIAIPIISLKALGATSVIKTAIPRAMGTATIKAKKDVIRVPNKGIAPPKSSLTGSQEEDRIKFRKPNLCIAGKDSLKRIRKIPKSKKIIKKAAKEVIIRKKRLKRCSLRGDIFI